jgi:acetolactate synthase-1/2/3 large subunit
MPQMKGGEVIAEYLAQQKMPNVIGICGHGNVGILDALYAVQDRIKLMSPRREQCAGHMAWAHCSACCRRM